MTAVGNREKGSHRAYLVRFAPDSLRPCRHCGIIGPCQFPTHAPQQNALTRSPSRRERSRVSGKSRPSALAVVRLMTILLRRIQSMRKGLTKESKKCRDLACCLSLERSPT